MLKKDEAADPASCWNRAGDDEPVFVVLGHDQAFADTIRFWVNKRIELGKNEPGDHQMTTALQLAESVERSAKGGYNVAT